MNHAKKRRPIEEDVEIGKRLRIIRLNAGLSQTALATAIGITFQQVQKYEKGVNRISAGRLQRAAKYLKVPITQFFKKNRPASTARRAYGRTTSARGGTTRKAASTHARRERKRA